MFFDKRNAAKLVILLSALNTTNVFADPAPSGDWYTLESLSDVTAAILSSFVSTLSFGPVLENAGKSQTINLGPQVDKTYTVNGKSQTLGDLEVFLGIQKQLQEQVQAQFGFTIGGTANTKMAGEIWDDADARFNNYVYRYEIKHTQVTFKTKLLADINTAVMPWISGSMGVGFNQAHLFNNSPTIFQAVATPNFTSYTTSAFTYTVGAGVQRALNKNWQIGLGYEFADWGKSQLSKTLSANSNSVLVVDHLYTNGILFNITYLA